jgi:phage terminase large subunit GpA-like protein
VNAHAVLTPDLSIGLMIDCLEGSFRPDPPLMVSAWADKNRVLASVSSAEPGRWRTSRTPYLREIMDCLSAYSPVEEVAVMKGVQVGMSEAAFNFVGYAIHHNPGPMMYVMPTEGMMKKFSKTRIDPMIEACPALRERVKPARARDSDNTVLQKGFEGGVLILTGANSGSGLRGLPVGKLVLDEVDGYPVSADDDGDPVTLATDRTSTFKGRKKIFKLSTPTLKETSRIGKAYREGDQRRYMVACEGCGARQPLTWDRIKWEPGKPETAAFVCASHDPETGELCEHRHPEHRKTALLAGGVWTPTATSTRPRMRSYHLSALYSPWYTWGECAFRFIGAKDDPSRLQPFVNNILGEEWEDIGGERIDPGSLMALRENYSDVPARAALLTAGVDVQPDRLEAEVVAWGKDEESWSIDYQIFPGDPNDLEVWDALDDYLSKRWQHPGFENGMPITAVAIDTGGANTQAAYRFIRPREGRRIWGIKGYAGRRAVWPRKPSRNNKGKINLYPIGVDSAKEVVIARLSKVGPDVAGAGACHFSEDVWDKDAFDQLTVERKRTRYAKGFPIIEWWKPDDARNERLDCRVYAYSVLQGLIVMGLNLNMEAARVASMVMTRLAAEAPTPAGEVVDAEDVARNRGITPPDTHAKQPKAKPRPRRRVTASPFMD